MSRKPDGLRITTTYDRGEAIEILVDGDRVPAYAGESVAAALLAAGRLQLRRSPADNPRGAFCMMGVCQECVVECDGRTVASCQTPCRPGLSVSLRSITDGSH